MFLRVPWSWNDLRNREEALSFAGGCARLADSLHCTSYYREHVLSIPRMGSERRPFGFFAIRVALLRGLCCWCCAILRSSCSNEANMVSIAGHPSCHHKRDTVRPVRQPWNFVPEHRKKVLLQLRSGGAEGSVRTKNVAPMTCWQEPSLACTSLPFLTARLERWLEGLSGLAFGGCCSGPSSPPFRVALGPERAPSNLSHRART